MLCNYSTLFGRVGEGVHSYRIANIAIVDVLATIIGAYLIHVATGYRFAYVLATLFFLGIVMHRMFCVPTTVDKFLFGST